MMNTSTVVLFGESEKGIFHTAYHFSSLIQLVDSLGNPPPDTQGLYYATQVLMHEQDLLFFRVQEEGFSYEDYMEGLNWLHQSQTSQQQLAAFCAPGLGNEELVDSIIKLCNVYHSIYITNESDLFDYLSIRP